MVRKCEYTHDNDAPCTNEAALRAVHGLFCSESCAMLEWLAHDCDERARMLAKEEERVAAARVAERRALALAHERQLVELRAAHNDAMQWRASELEFLRAEKTLLERALVDVQQRCEDAERRCAELEHAEAATEETPTEARAWRASGVPLSPRASAGAALGEAHRRGEKTRSEKTRGIDEAVERALKAERRAAEKRLTERLKLERVAAVVEYEAANRHTVAEHAANVVLGVGHNISTFFARKRSTKT